MSEANGYRWSKFWWQDWAGDAALRACSLAAQGLWMRLLCVMHEATPRGYLLLDGQPPTAKQLAGITGATLKELAALLGELRQARVYSIDPEGWIYSRRMVKDTAASAKGRETGKQGGNPQLVSGTVAKEDRERRWRRAESPSRVLRIFERSEGKCHWCAAPLARDAFHVDHVIAIRDGGGNDEENLVAACPECNGKRAIGLTPPTTPNPRKGLTPTTTVEVNPDHNPLEAEVQAEADPVRVKKVLSLKPLTGETAPRGRENPVPDALNALLSEAEKFERKPDDPLPPQWQAQAKRAAKALTMSVPYAKVVAVDAATDAQLEVEANMGLKWQPRPPVRDRSAQQAAALAGSSPEQIAKAKAAFEQRAARRA
jgi:5-methylcytosine-specific restriction endonuclease McrA